MNKSYVAATIKWRSFLKNLLLGFIAILFITYNVSAQQAPAPNSRPGPKCEGRPLTIDKARSWFRPGGGNRSIKFGKGKFTAFTQQCTKFSGCAPWHESETSFNKVASRSEFIDLQLVVWGSPLKTVLSAFVKTTHYDGSNSYQEIKCQPVGAPNLFGTTRVACSAEFNAFYSFWDYETSDSETVSFIPVFTGIMTDGCLSLTASHYLQGGYQVQHIINLSAQY